jgi:hypothetical protein
MKPISSYPLWLSASMLLGPFFTVSGIGFRDRWLIWVFQSVGALMVMFALFYFSKRLHEQMEVALALRYRGLGP